MQVSRSRRSWLPIAMGVTLAICASGAIAVGWFLLLLVSAFAFDSPNRTTSSGVVFYTQLVGAVLAVIAAWTLCLGATLTIQRPKRVVTIAVGIGLALVGFATLLVGAGLAFLGP